MDITDEQSKAIDGIREVLSEEVNRQSVPNISHDVRAEGSHIFAITSGKIPKVKGLVISTEFFSALEQSGCQFNSLVIDTTSCEFSLFSSLDSFSPVPKVPKQHVRPVDINIIHGHWKDIHRCTDHTQQTQLALAISTHVIALFSTLFGNPCNPKISFPKPLQDSFIIYVSLTVYPTNLPSIVFDTNAMSQLLDISQFVTNIDFVVIPRTDSCDIRLQITMDRFEITTKVDWKPLYQAPESQSRKRVRDDDEFNKVSKRPAHLPHNVKST